MSLKLKMKDLKLDVDKIYENTKGESNQNDQH